MEATPITIKEEPNEFTRPVTSGRRRWFWHWYFSTARYTSIGVGRSFDETTATFDSTTITWDQV